MDHMRISGTEPSLLILSQKKAFSKVEEMSQKPYRSAHEI